MNRKLYLQPSAIVLAACAWCVSITGMAATRTPNDALVDQVMQKIESSGALDKALDRALERYVQRQKEQQQKAAEAEQQRRADMVKNARKVDPARDHIWGDEKARVSVIVYSDLECPFCKRFATIPENVADKSSGQANVVWRHFPLEMHGANARKEAIASECVAASGGSGNFFGFVDTVLKQTRSNGQGLEGADSGLVELAGKFGASEAEAFKVCLQDGKANAAVEEDIRDGSAAGIEGTPGVLLRDNISGKTIVAGGYLSESALAEKVKNFLAEGEGKQ